MLARFFGKQLNLDAWDGRQGLKQPDKERNRRARAQSRTRLQQANKGVGLSPEIYGGGVKSKQRGVASGTRRGCTRMQLHEDFEAEPARGSCCALRRPGVRRFLFELTNRIEFGRLRVSGPNAAADSGGRATAREEARQ